MNDHSGLDVHDVTVTLWPGDLGRGTAGARRGVVVGGGG